MRKFLLGICTSILLFSCGDISEELVVNEDMSGTYTVSYDMMEAMTGMMKGFAMAMAESEGKTIDMDSLDLALRDKMWKDFPDELDSVIDLSDKFKEEGISNEGLEKYQDKMNMYMRGSKAKGEMEMGFEMSFDNPSDFSEYYRFLSSLSENNEIGSKMGPGIGSVFSGLGQDNSGDAPFIFTKNGIKREAFSMSDDDKKLSSKDMKEFEEMFGSMSYTTTIRVPKDIKKVKGKGAVKKDNRTVVIEYQLLDLMNAKEMGGFEIIYVK